MRKKFTIHQVIRKTSHITAIQHTLHKNSQQRKPNQATNTNQQTSRVQQP